MSERRIILHVTVSGQVQGVGYRAWVEQQATASRLEGWVRNRHDGGVEAVFSGPPRAVAEIVALCRRGPSAARVEAVRDDVGDESHLALRHAGEAFSVLPTI